MRNLKRGLQGIVLGAAVLALPAMAAEPAEKFPSKPIRIMG